MRTKLLKWSSFGPHFTQKISFSPCMIYVSQDLKNAPLPLTFNMYVYAFYRENVLCCKYALFKGILIKINRLEVLKSSQMGPHFTQKVYFSPIENILTSSPQSKIPFLQALHI